MQIVIDSNILFSALIKDSLTRRIILEYKENFLFPSFIFEEMEKHKLELLEKSGMSREDFNKLLELILKKVSIVAYEVICPYKERALELVKNIDENDVMFIACALAYPSSIIWSDDKKLKKLKNIKIINTKEFIQLVKE